MARVVTVGMVAGMILLTSGVPASAGRGGFGPNFGDNAWGCKMRYEYPHSSHKEEGGWIHAEARTVCDAGLPEGSVFHTYQELYRSSWRGPLFVAKNRSYCPNRAPKDYPGDKHTDCYGDRKGINALVRWKCEPGSTYTYTVKNWHYFEVGRDRYSGESWAEEQATCEQ